jgi:hypothetical protein
MEKMMNPNTFFTGTSAIFWGLTLTLMGLIALAATIGGYQLARIVLVAAGVYSVIGLAYGLWTALRAVARASGPLP